MSPTAVGQGETIDAQYLAPLRESSDLIAQPQALRARLLEEGYVYLRQFFARDDVLAARRDIFTRLAEVGEIAEPPLEGIFTGTSRRDELVGDRGAFWRSVSETWTAYSVSAVTGKGPGAAPATPWMEASSHCQGHV